jgi:AmmeMemoRadiSam system protein B/AmmeMemoRadiSam system protein A
MILVVTGLVACQKAAAPSQTTASSETRHRIREPAVAGLFYPKEQPVLARMIAGLLEAAPENSIADLKALVCPHAGYLYSGITAAAAYRNLAGRQIQTVIVLAPSHYAAFQGAFIPDLDLYQTPLGAVPISDKAKQLAKISPFGSELRCQVQRPSWWRQSSRSAPATGEDTPDTWEHSGEVQVPFLQTVLKNFKLLPIVIGEADPEQAARVLAKQWDDQTLLVASSDLSHYYPYEKAKEMDNRCVKAIRNLDFDQMRAQEACGKLPILTLMHLAKQKGWKARLLDYRNSGDTAGDKSGVVGYAALAFYAPGQENFNQQERKFLFDLAKRTIREVVTQGKLPAVEPASLAKKFTEPKGCFVTLTKHGALRGCIGHIVPKESLYKAIMDNAQGSAVRDPRFPPVQPNELDQLEIEISILTVPQPLQFSSPDDLLSQLQPHKDGVVLQIGPRGATYLPQVWAQIPNKVDFLNHLAQKAGCAPADWRNKDATVSVYRVESFKESDL